MAEPSATLNPVQNLIDLVSAFTDVALADPISPLLMAVGGLVMVVALGFFAYLFLGAAVDFVTPERSGRRPPQRG